METAIRTPYTDGIRGEFDASGRPMLLVDRVNVVAALMSQFGFCHSEYVLHTMMWWEAVVANGIGCSVDNVDFERDQDAVRVFSPSVQALLDELRTGGQLFRPDHIPVDSDQMFFELWPVDGGPNKKTSRDWFEANWHTPWMGCVSEFISTLATGFHIREDGSMDWHGTGGQGSRYIAMSTSSPQASADIRLILAGDVAFLSDDGIGVGPHLFQLIGDTIKKSKPVPDDWVSSRRGKLHAAIVYARHLLTRVANKQAFGETEFLRCMDDMTVQRRQRDDGTAGLQYCHLGKPAAYVVTVPGSERDPATARSFAFSDDITPVVMTAVIRHLQTTDVTRVGPPATDKERSVWGQHGWPDDDGLWTLERVHWGHMNVAPEEDAKVTPEL